jgi:hypothetical protein
MSKINEIEEALNRINGDVFQEFCNHFLYFKLNPNSIEPIGSVIGKEKSRKGIPDSYLTTKDGELVFAEFTTKEKLGKNKSFLNKLKQDINNCFNESKTKIKSDNIKKVILCFTNRINPKERKDLQDLCNMYNPSCELVLYGIRDLSYAVLDYHILGQYIGIKVSTGQIQTPSEFVTEYEKSKLSTPLSNKLYGRQEEIKDGLEKLKNNDILIVHGSSGSGKSKYSIELCKQFVNKNKNYKFLCISNKGIPIWDDLKSYINKDSYYIILVDDANRFASSYRLVLNTINESNVKIIVTVRDYALSPIKGISSEFNYSLIELKELSRDVLKQIISSKDFKITNIAYIERIQTISKGNARLAIMCSKVALETNNILSLYDASQIFEEYYKPIFTEVKILSERNTLICLAVLSFFNRIDRENREFCDDIFRKLNFDEEIFWGICYSLNENELVDLYEKQVVKFSDQIFSTYIFYKVVVDLELIKFKFFLDNYLDYKSRINDTIIPVINIFSYKKIEEKLKTQILLKWDDIKQHNQFDSTFVYIDLFWFYLNPQIFSYLKKHIDSLDEPLIKNYKYTYELNEFSFGVDNVIDILSRYRHLERETYKVALELMFYYAIKIPDKMPFIVYTIKEKFSFSRLGYQYGYDIQHILIDYLVSNAMNGSNTEVYEKILEQIIPHFLKIKYKESESQGRQIMLYTFNIWLNDSIKSFRKKCFEYLENKIKTKKESVIQIFYHLPIYDYSNSKEVYEFDKTFLFPIIDNYFDMKQFEDCFILQELIEKLVNIKLEYPEDLQTRHESKLYYLAEVLKWDRNYSKKGISHQEEEKLHEIELVNYSNGFNYKKYIELFDNVSLILRKIREDHIGYQYFRSIDIIIGNVAATNANLFYKLLVVLDNYEFKLNYTYIFNSFFETNSKNYLKLFNIIKEYKPDLKIQYHQTLRIENVKSIHIELLYNDLQQSISNIGNIYSFWNIDFIEKFAVNKSKKEVFEEILVIILSISKKEGAKISISERFIERCLGFPEFPLKMIKDAYFLSYKNGQHFDFKKSLLKKIVEKDYRTIVELLKKTYPEKISYHDVRTDNLEFIWGLNKYKVIIRSIFDFFLKKKQNIYWKSAINAFFPKNSNEFSNKPIAYLESSIQDNFDNSSVIQLVFNIVCNSYPHERDRLLGLFLSLNSDFGLFTKIEFVPSEGAFVGSRIPIIESEKKSWERVMKVLNGLPNRLNFIEHKEFVDKRVRYCTIDLQNELKRDFLDDYK